VKALEFGVSYIPSDSSLHRAALVDYSRSSRNEEYHLLAPKELMRPMDCRRLIGRAWLRAVSNIDDKDPDLVGMTHYSPGSVIGQFLMAEAISRSTSANTESDDDTTDISSFPLTRIHNSIKVTRTTRQTLPTSFLAGCKELSGS